MKTIEQFEQASYLGRRASGACYDYPAALGRLSRHMGLPVRTVRKLVTEAVLPLRDHLFSGRRQCPVILSEDGVAAIGALRTGKLVKGRSLNTGPKGD